LEGGDAEETQPTFKESTEILAGRTGKRGNKKLFSMGHNTALKKGETDPRKNKKKYESCVQENQGKGVVWRLGSGGGHSTKPAALGSEKRRRWDPNHYQKKAFFEVSDTGT